METKRKLRNTKRRVRPRRRNRARRAANNATRYMYSRTLQTMGVGTAKVRVTRFYTYQPAPVGTNQNFVSEIVRDSVASQEFNRFAQDFSYCRLQKLTITCVPSSGNSNIATFLKIDWIDGEAQDVTFDDNAKLIWMTTMKPITYKFKPPNILLNNLNEDKPIKINYREWQDSKTLVAENIPGYLKVTTGLITRLIGEVVWVFRGYNAKFPYSAKEIINNKGQDIKKEDEIGEIIRDLKGLAMKKDQLDEIEEKKEEKKERKEKREREREKKKNRDKSKEKVLKNEIKEIKEDDKESDTD